MESLRVLPAAGSGAFEGFCAALLTASCRMPFVVAASGSQPTGDAIATSGRSCIQAKRYRANTALRINDIVGSIYSAFSSLRGLEVFVLVVTRDAAQLRQQVLEVELRTGLDIVVLDVDNGLSSLGALVVTHWAAVRDYFPKLDATWDVWAAKCAADTAVASKVTEATGAMRGGLRTQHWLQAKSHERLLGRFAAAVTSSAIDPWQRIDLARAVPRRSIQKCLSEWWAQEAQPNAELRADEGYGKTWTAAAFALELTSSGTVVLWLESNQWAGSDSVESLIRSALSSVLPDGDERLDAFTRKALRLWARPILVVLDGVNQHGCLEAAQRLLDRYNDHRTHYAQRLRILFTTRPLTLRPKWVKALWATCRQVSVDPFDDQELTAALALHAPGVGLGDLSESLRPLARVPRYFHLAIRLRDRLRGHDVITKPLLLFADLLEKLESSTPGFRELFPDGKLRGAEQILAHLASNAKAQLPEGWEVSREHVMQCFSHLGPTLFELSEGRVLIEQRPGSVVVNALHVTLGFALHLIHVGEQSKADEIGALADEIAKVLEPNREQDTRTEALYLALLLTCLRPRLESTARLRSALLALWWSGHNAEHSQDRLDFWTEEDVRAYLEALETVFCRTFSAPTEESLISPLARLWRDDCDRAEGIRPTLERWLALVYPRTFEDDSPSEAVERASYPFATGREMLRLSSVAISIVSQRPDSRLLPALARCARSGRYCVEKHWHGGKAHTFHLKDLGGVLSILLRWGYGEGIIAELESLARKTTDGSLMDGYQSLANFVQTAKLPEVLQRKPKEPPFKFSWPDNSPAAVRSGLSQWILQLPTVSEHWPRSHHIGRLAANLQVSDLSADESAAVARYLDEIGKRHADSRTNDYIEGYSDLLPWLARSAPGMISTVHASCWNAYLDSANPSPVAWEPLVPISPDRIESLLARIISDPRNVKKVRSAESFSTRFTITVLLSTEEEAWLKWFKHLAENPGILYEAWEIIPAPYVLARVATPRFRAQVRELYDSAIAEESARASTSSRGSEFWLKILATSIDANNSNPDLGDYAKWAACELRTIKEDDKRTSSFLRLVAMSGDAGLLEEMLHDEKLRRHLGVPRLAQTFGHFLRQPVDRKIKISYRDVAGQMPLNLARGFLLMASEDDDLVDYSRAVARIALAKVSAPSAQPPFGFVSQFSVDENGDIEGWGLERGQNANSYAQHCGGSALWGVDRGSFADFSAFLMDRGKADERLESLNSEIVRQNERHENVPDSFLLMFYGSAAIATWSRLHPAEYLGFVQMFSSRLKAEPDYLFDLGAFTYALLRPLCLLDLSLACNLHNEFFVKNAARVFLSDLIPAFVADLWHHSLNGVEGIDSQRKQTLLESRHDLHLLWLTLAAIKGENLDVLGKIIQDFQRSDWGKDRALAATVMAFSGDVCWLKSLHDMEEGDSSKWVRRQAEWARAVLEENLSAKNLWDQICAMRMELPSDFELLAARLVQLRPVLPVAARWWPRPAWEMRNTRAGALLLAFFGEWKNSSSSRGKGEICGRSLEKFCFGEGLDRDHATRLFPWWRP